MTRWTRSIRSAVAAALLPLLAGCFADIRSTVVADPLDVTPYQGFWTDARKTGAQVLMIEPEDGARSAKVTHVWLFMTRERPVDWSALRAQVTAIGDVRYVELTSHPDSAQKPEVERMMARVSFGTAETPDDRDKLSVCFLEADMLKGPIQQGALKGVIVTGRKDGFIPERDKVRITASTAELRAYLATTPLKCAASSWQVFVRAKAHFPSNALEPPP